MWQGGFPQQAPQQPLGFGGVAAKASGTIGDRIGHGLMFYLCANFGNPLTPPLSPYGGEGVADARKESPFPVTIVAYRGAAC